MASTQSKVAKLNNKSVGTGDSPDASSGGKSPNLMFPADLLAEGHDGACMTFFVNTIKNGQAKINFKGGFSTAKNGALQSAYGEVPVVHTTGKNLQGGNSKMFSNTFVRSNQSITLPMPKNIDFNLSARWSATELGAAAAGIDQMTDISKIMQNGTGGELAKQLGLNTVGSIASKFAGGAIKGKELVELGTATVTNSYSETLFKSVDNRSFSWNWTLTPRNEKESEMLDDLIRMFRFHMLPEFKENAGNGNAFLLYPSSFDIVFWQDGAPNQYIPRISTCALVSCNTNFTPNGGYIRYVNGSPASYQLSLSFIELSILHKGMVGNDNANTGTTF